MKLNFKINKEINKIINEFIENEKYYYIENDNLYNLLDINIFNKDYDLKENIINKIENEKKLNYKEITLLKKYLKDLIKNILNNDIENNINLMNEILNNDKINYDLYIYNEKKHIYNLFKDNFINDSLKEILKKHYDKITFKENVIYITLNNTNTFNIIENYNFNIDLIKYYLFENEKYLNQYLETY